jgi:integrase
MMTVTLSQRVQEYLRLRRALGFRLQREGQVLPQFAAYLEQAGAATVTAGHAIAWAQLPQGVDPVNWTHRLTAVRSFAAWLRTIDPATEIPPRGVFPGQGKRPVPFIYSGSDITALISACGSLRPRTRAATYTALFGLIAVTGIRIGEAFALDAADLDAAAQVLAVTGKYGRTRLIALHPTTAAALTGYLQIRAARAADGTSALLIGQAGRRLSRNMACAVFRSLAAGCGLAPQPGCGSPRLHDFRHTVAVSTLTDALRHGRDVDACIAVLATHLGHVSPAHTYWYYSDSRVIPIPAPLRA